MSIETNIIDPSYPNVVDVIQEHSTRRTDTTHEEPETLGRVIRSSIVSSMALVTSTNLRAIVFDRSTDLWHEGMSYSDTILNILYTNSNRA